MKNVKTVQIMIFSVLGGEKLTCFVRFLLPKWFNLCYHFFWKNL